MNSDEASTSKQLSIMGDLENVSPAADILGQSEYFTSIEENYDTAVGEDAGSNARVFPSKLQGFAEFQCHDIIPLHQIGQGGQGKIYEVLIKRVNRGNQENRMPEYHTCAMKLFEGSPNDNQYGQWPEEVYGLGSFSFICEFQGYVRDFNGHFGLLMKKYDTSLRKMIDELRENGKGRPFNSFHALRLIIQIALGMACVHKGNVLHRDLKADNVFICKDSEDGMPWGAYLGDFDISDTVLGTGFWRAPELLEALQNRRAMLSFDKLPSIPYTPMADVYSFAMTCYEILTGRIPFEGYARSDWTPVLSGIRPDLPRELNPLMRDLICKCWSQNPQDRPRFHDIVSELKDMVGGTRYLKEMIEKEEKKFGLRKEVCTLTPKESLVQLNCLLKSLRLRYPKEMFYAPGDEDFVLLGFQYLDLIKSFISQFGFESYIDTPILPWSTWWSRRKLHDEIIHTMRELIGGLPMLVESMEMFYLIMTISENINENAFDSRYSVEDGIPLEQLDLEYKALVGRGLNLSPIFDRHQDCRQIDNTEDSPICDICKKELPLVISSQPYVKADYFGTFRLYLDEINNS